MTIFDKHFALGLGTNRFPINSFTDTAGIDQSIQLVLFALESGVDYIDVAHNYSRALAHDVLKKAFAQTKREFSVTVKSSYSSDKTADDVKHRVENSLDAMGIQRAAYFVVWNISSYSQFIEIIQRGGLYDGAQYCKERGIIDSICFSTHAKPDDVVKIMETGLFDGVTISHNITSANTNKCIFEAASKLRMGVAIMNPLAGGLIPQNPEYFKFACNEKEDNVIVSALRYDAAEPSVKIVLTGASSIDELKENLIAFTTVSSEAPRERLSRVNTAFCDLPNYCTGCNYCSNCPKNIPISTIMSCRNALSFKSTDLYGKSDTHLMENIRLFREMQQKFQYVLHDFCNPCVKCGICEKNCTRKLHIIDDISDTFVRAKEANYSLKGMKERLDVLLNKKGYRRVGFYPAGGYTSFVLQKYNEFFGEPLFDCLLFDSNKLIWGTKNAGLNIHSPSEIIDLSPDCLFICNYKYQAEIYESLCHYQSKDIDIICLHNNDDVPWVF